MFKKSVSIFYLTNEEIIAAKADTAIGEIHKIEKRTYTENELSTALRAINQQIKARSAFCLIPEEKTHLRLITLPIEIQNIHQAVEEQLGISLPERLTNLTFDIKEMAKTKKSRLIQVLAASTNYLTLINIAFEQAGIKILTLESPSFALARLTQRLKEPHLIIYLNEMNLLTAAFQGEVLIAVIENDLSKLHQRIHEIVGFVKYHFGLEIKRLLVSDYTKEFDKTLLEEFVIEEKTLNPLSGLAQKKDLTGRDEVVLSLTPPQVKKSELPITFKTPKIKTASFTSLSEQIKKERGSSLAKSLFVIIILIALGATIFANKDHLLISNWWQKIQLPFGAQAPVTPSPQLSPTAIPSLTPSPTQIPTPTPLDKFKLSLQVLNGNGVRGDANKAREVLENAGFKVDAVANAQSFAYTKTQLQIKKSKEGYLEELKNALQDKYNLEITADLTEDYPYDGILIVGLE